MEPETVTRAQLNFDLPSRVRYMKSFLDFTEDDCQIMEEVRPIAKPLVPEIVASAYTKLLSYDACRMAFFPRKDGAQGTHGTVDDLVDSNDQLGLNSATIKLRRNILERWAMRIFTADYHHMEIFEFFDQIGIQHTGGANGGARVYAQGTQRPIYIDYIHLAMTLGHITSKMTAAILTLPASTWTPEKKTRAIVAFHKISTIHNDLIARHHIGELSSPSTSPVQTPEHDISPQNRKEYYTHVFMVGSPPRMNSPPRDAPFQSVFNLTQDLTSTSGISTTNHTTQPIEFSQVTTVEQPTTSTSEIRVQKTGPAALGDAITYFPGKYTESLVADTQTLTRTSSKTNATRRKFGTKSKKTPSSS
ncbi:hypothetical protein PCANC_06125 [Puccinia coronata f. sp. avenae]|uniref:Globin-sensor domain-containing protein n=1 Tax=Puccinia coronata f. sp. avenae TaxID=200324 RepID=A0A2N5VTV2_9BASI|nr:hypothetical protein PCANC_10890 [Puccinia coronata f. sp. avenae]PLW38349.1 hypothetical protein PCASD_10551 [Puccinia coronata f. sp. avenae]PLW53428.1 hypothetical protein PCANC_06125 [Puccinia coronata f. sp. avenae]